MASIKLILRKNKQKSDGTIPIAIRITKDRKTRYVFTGQYVLEGEWDGINQRVKKSHQNSSRLNHMLTKKVAEANDALIESEVSESHVSAALIKQKIKRSDKGTSFFEIGCDRVLAKHNSGTFSVSISELSILTNMAKFMEVRGKRYSETLKESIREERKKRIGESRKSGYHFPDRVKQLVKNNALNFTDIDATFIKDYKLFCKSCLDQSTRTTTNQLIFIRTLFNQAIKEGLVDSKHYPFGGDKEKIRFGSGTKVGLSREELERIECFNSEPDTQVFHARNTWLFSFYFAGIRISDVMKMQWKDIMDGRLYYVMNKNEKPISLKIPTKAQVILDVYRTENTRQTDHIFPYMKGVNANNPKDVFTKAKNGSSLINKYLKKLAKECDITKILSNHIARHTFGNLAGDTIHPLMLQKLYRHSDLKTTINYQANFIHKEADDALDNVIGGGNSM